jgi:GMP synthase (glutamine-hydrolysing)
MKKIVIIKCGDTREAIKNELGDFEDWIIQSTNLPANMFAVYNLPKGDLLRHPDEFIGGIITGSDAMVTDNSKWMKQLKDWIVTARYSNLPVLGICFGHQIMAEALGGKVTTNTAGESLGAIEVEFTTSAKTDSLFKGLGDSLETFAVHGQHVTMLPVGSEILARGKKAPIQAFKVGKMYGVQFHPEFNGGIMKLYADESGIKNHQKIKTKIRFEYRNQKVISNFIDICVKF